MYTVALNERLDRMSAPEQELVMAGWTGLQVTLFVLHGLISLLNKISTLCHLVQHIIYLIYMSLDQVLHSR